MTSTLGPPLCCWLLLGCVVLTSTDASSLPRVEEYEPSHPYSFAYNIHNVSTTGDTKSRQESRQGDVVSGSYILFEHDGSGRTDHFTAGPHRGFHAVLLTEVEPVQERTTVHQHGPLPLLFTNTRIVEPATPTPTTPGYVAAVTTPAAAGIPPAPPSITTPFLQYIGVRPSYQFAGAPYYQLQPVT